MPGQFQAQSQITPQTLMEIFNIGEEEAAKILQVLPQLCQTANPQIQREMEIQAIQRGMDIQNFQSFLNIINGPLVTDQERAFVYQLSVKDLYEIAQGTSLLGMAGNVTKDSLSRIAWSDAIKKNIKASEVAEWIVTVLIPRVLTPMMAGQEEIARRLMQMAQYQQAMAAAQQQQAPQQQAQAQQQNQNQNQNQIRYPWKNSNGDMVWYKMFKDSTGTKTIMSDSLEMEMVQDSVKIDEDGILTGDAVMTAAMVQTYMKDGKEQKVLKDPEELRKACDIWRVGMPCTDQHPEEGLVMNQDEVVGYTTPPIWDASSGNVTCQVTIHDGKTVEKIKEGKTDVSIGFFCDLHETPGTFGDSNYDAVQRNIVFNHLAVGLDKGRGRCPDGTCGIQAGSKDNEIDWNKYNHLPCVGETHYDWLMQDYPPKTEEERAMSHFNITPEDWAKLSAEEKAAKIKALPERGSGMDAKLSAEQRAALKESDFCGPGRSFPVPDCAHYTAALRMLPRYQGPGNKDEIHACIIRKGKSLGCKGAEDAQTLKHNIEVQNAKVKEGEYRLMPGYPDTHDHFATLDAEGNGISSENNGHMHEIKGMNVLLEQGHSHDLVPHSSEEETPMSDEEKKKNEDKQEEKSEKDSGKKPANEPKNKAKSEDKAEPPAEKPAEKDMASKYVEQMIKAEHTKLVDAIMDRNPPKEREHYEGKTLDELKELKEFLDSVAPGDNSIPAGKRTASDSTKAIDDAYASVEEKLHTN